jgi:hypothetical protein
VTEGTSDEGAPATEAE